MPLLLTPGEPAGIGPDITLQLLTEGYREQLVVVADADMLQQRARQLGIDIELHTCDDIDTAKANRDINSITVLHVPTRVTSVAGKLDQANSAYVLECLDLAAQLCRDQQASALVTCPIHKGIINDAGYAFSGHTEHLAAPTASTPVMMLASERMRVALATTHLPLRDVADALSADMLVEKLSITHDFLQQRFRLASPRLLVCGLNPHAGEGGHLGHEEIDIIQPAIARCRERGMELSDATPADTAFNPGRLADYDAVFAMYHDQGLPVLKHSSFGTAVNITMGLPFIRTSVDHGTALELVGSGKASANSLRHAVNTALSLI